MKKILVDLALADQQEARIRLYLENDRRQGFDLRQDSLLRLALFKLAEGYRLIKSNHHIISGRLVFAHYL